jgi:putative membrane protein
VNGPVDGSVSQPRKRRGPLVHDVAALERTALAWERTAISLGAVGTLLLKLVRGGGLAEAAGIALVGSAALIVLVMVPAGYRRARERVDADNPGQAFAAQDRWRHVALGATAALVSLTVLAVSLDLLVDRG